VRRAQLRGSSSDVTVDRDDVSADRGDELIDGFVCVALDRVYEDLGVHAGGEDDAVSSCEPWAQYVDGALMLVV
jgi:hypothetical protein